MEELIKKQLDEYLTQNFYNYAFMLNGKWGVGKTYFIKQYIKDCKGKEFVYLSLNGIENVEDIDVKLTEVLIKEHLGKGKFKSITFKDVTKDILKQVNYKNIVGLFNKEYKKIITETILDIMTDIIDENNVVLIFDDLERCKVDYEKLLAYINEYVEHQELKTILIADESRIKENNENDVYNRVKEKVIGTSIEYLPDIKYIAEKLLENKKIESDIENIIKRNNEQFYKELMKQEHLNIRTVQFIIDKFTTFYNLILKNSKFKGNEELEDKIFNYMVYISILYKKDGKNEFDWGNLKYGYINFDEKCLYKNYRYGFKFIDEYITNGIINKEEIELVLKDYDYSTLPKDNTYELLKNGYWEMKDEEVYFLIDKLYENIKEGKYKINLVSKLLALLLKMEDFGYELKIEKFIKQFKNLIDMEERSIDLISAIDSIEILNMNDNVKNKYQEILRELKAYAAKIMFEEINRIILNKQFEKFMDGSFWKSNENLILQNGFFCNIDLKKLLNIIDTMTEVKQLWYFKYFCDSLVNNYQLENFVNKDLKSIKNLEEELGKLKLDEYGVSKKKVINYIIADLKVMENINNK